MRRPWCIGRTSPKLALYCFWQETELFFTDNRTKPQVIQPKYAPRRKFWPQTTPENKISLPVKPKDLDMTGTWMPEPFQKRGVRCPRRASAKAPFITPHHKWPNSSALQWKPALHTSRLPLTHKSSTKPQIREPQLWALPPVSLPADLARKPFLFSKAGAIVLYWPLHPSGSKPFAW